MNGLLISHGLSSDPASPPHDAADLSKDPNQSSSSAVPKIRAFGQLNIVLGGGEYALCYEEI